MPSDAAPTVRARSVDDRATFQRHAGTVRALAREHGTYHAPVCERMTAEGGDSPILADHVHPNPAGHDRIAAILAGATRH